VILETIREAQLEGRVQSKREVLDWVDRYMATGSWPDEESG